MANMLGEGLQQLKTVREGYKSGEDRAYELAKRDIGMKKLAMQDMKDQLLYQADLEATEAKTYSEIPELSEDIIPSTMLTDEAISEIIDGLSDDEFEQYNRLSDVGKNEFIQNKIRGASTNPYYKYIEDADKQLEAIKNIEAKGVGRAPDSVEDPQIGPMPDDRAEVEKLLDPSDSYLRPGVEALKKGTSATVRGIGTGIGAIGAGLYEAGKRGLDLIADPEPSGISMDMLKFNPDRISEDFEDYKKRHPRRISKEQFQLKKNEALAKKEFGKALLKSKTQSELEAAKLRQQAYQKEQDRINDLRIASERRRAKPPAARRGTMDKADDQLYKQSVKEMDKRYGMSKKKEYARQIYDSFKTQEAKDRWKRAYGKYLESGEPKPAPKPAPKPKQKVEKQASAAGEIRQMGNIKYQKQPNGKWKKIK